MNENREPEELRGNDRSGIERNETDQIKGLTGAIFRLVGVVAAVIFAVAVFVLGDAVPGATSVLGWPANGMQIKRAIYPFEFASRYTADVYIYIHICIYRFGSTRWTRVRFNGGPSAGYDRRDFESGFNPIFVSVASGKRNQGGKEE